MADGMWAVLMATATLVAVYAAWWLVRHELDVRRFRARAQDAGSGDRR
jgi:hypothetical protein